jgi:hypothetical protein
VTLRLGLSFKDRSTTYTVSHDLSVPDTSDSGSGPCYYTLAPCVTLRGTGYFRAFSESLGISMTQNIVVLRVDLGSLVCGSRGCSNMTLTALTMGVIGPSLISSRCPTPESYMTIFGVEAIRREVLSTGAIAGIVIGCVAGVGLFILIIGCCCCKKSKPPPKPLELSRPIAISSPSPYPFQNAGLNPKPETLPSPTPASALFSSSSSADSSSSESKASPVSSSSSSDSESSEPN